MPVKHLIFIRHGQSRHHVEARTGGWTDSSLTEFGRAQMAAVAAHLKGLDLVANTGLYSSDLERAASSASIIGASLGLEPLLLTELRELGNGDAAGLTELEAARIARPVPTERDVDWRPYENAESYRELSQRALTALQIMETRGNETAIVIGHGLAGQALVAAWLGLPIDTPIAFNFDAGSLAELRINRWGERQIERLNVAVSMRDVSS